MTLITMDYITLFLIALSLAMDAFAVAVCNGIIIKNVKIYHATVFGLTFGGFQFVMPVAGYYLGNTFVAYIESFSHWIAFALLAFIGGKMLLDTFRTDKADKPDLDENVLSFFKLFTLGIITSIDALTVGVSLAITGWNIWISAIIIGGVAFTLSFVGVLAGNKLGMRFQKNASRLGGLVLIGIGVKILIEHFIS